MKSGDELTLATTRTDPWDVMLDCMYLEGPRVGKPTEMGGRTGQLRGQGPGFLWERGHVLTSTVRTVAHTCAEPRTSLDGTL